MDFPQPLGPKMECWCCRNFSPSKECHSFLLNDDLKHLLRLTKSQFIIREEEHSDSIFSFFSNIDIGCLTGFAKELMRNLKHDSYTISCLSCCIFTCTML